MKLFVLPVIAALGACVPVATPEPSQAPPARVQPAGTSFTQPGGKPFVWRGITAFRLAEQIASGREADAVAYLDWAAANDITVVRVLAMAQHLFTLAPADGLRALPRLLELAAQRNVHVEVVALADTAGLNLDLDAHVAAAGKIAAAHPNTFLEIANEPFHPTQDPKLHDRAILTRLAALVPEDVVVAYGSDAPGNSGGGDYVTVHMPRGEDAWDHVLALAEGRELVARHGRPVVSDEPMGAGARFDPGRRDDSPMRFRAAAMLTRIAGMHATFHYEGGLQARIPEGVELAAFKAWLDGLQSPPARIERARRCLAAASPRAKTIACLASAAEGGAALQGSRAVAQPFRPRVRWRSPSGLAFGGAALQGSRSVAQAFRPRVRALSASGITLVGLDLDVRKNRPPGQRLDEGRQLKLTPCYRPAVCFT